MKQGGNAHKIFGPMKFREQATRETYAFYKVK